MKPALLELLKTYGGDMTEKNIVPKVVKRREWEDHLVRIFLKYFKPHPLLIGEQGVGKSSLFKGLMGRL